MTGRNHQDVADDREALGRLRATLSKTISCRQHRVIREAMSHINARLRR